MYPLIIEKKDILAPGTVILAVISNWSRKEDLNEFWAVLKHKNRFMQGIECTPPPLFLDIKNNRRLDKGRLLLDCCTCGKPKREFPVK
jgi:hypothetical protein